MAEDSDPRPDSSDKRKFQLAFRTSQFDASTAQQQAKPLAAMDALGDHLAVSVGRRTLRSEIGSAAWLVGASFILSPVVLPQMLPLHIGAKGVQYLRPGSRKDGGSHGSHARTGLQRNCFR